MSEEVKDEDLQAVKRRRRYRFKTKITPWLVLALPMGFTIWLKYYPIISALVMSLFKYDPIDPPGTFVGFKNYQTIFNTSYYRQAWSNTFVFLFLQIAMCFFIPIIQALFLNELQKTQRGFTTLYILPSLVPAAINVIIWRYIWHPDYGVANAVVKFFGGQPQAWLSDANLVKFCIIFPGVIGGGLSVLLYLSAIQSVSTDIFEAAEIDGCTGFKRIWYIILPNISYMIFIQLIQSVILAMQLLDAPFMYTGGGPSGASTTQGIYIYNEFNANLSYGTGAAASIILFLVTMIITALQMRLERKGDK